MNQFLAAQNSLKISGVQQEGPGLITKPGPFAIALSLGASDGEKPSGNGATFVASNSIGSFNSKDSDSCGT